MRPYLAIIKDSFREAIASYLLWILLAICTIPLLAIAPLALDEKESVGLTQNDVLDAQVFLEKVLEAAQQEEPSPGLQVWNAMSKEYKTQLQDLASVQNTEEIKRGDVLDLLYELPKELNRILAEPGFFREEAFTNVELSAETRSLLDLGLQNISASRIVRLNRLLLHDAFPREISAARNKDFVLKYFKWELATYPAFDKTSILGAVLAWLVNVIMGFVALWLAIIFTSSFVPRAFEAGSVDLLLSKPLARPLIFLAKFVGGCSFTFLCSAYFIGGLWLIMGLRFGFWDWRLLLSVPILLFLFAVYYSVSALAGVLWRSAVVSVVVAVAFWAMCFGVEKAKKAVEFFAMRPQALRHVVQADRSLLAVDEQGRVLQWFSDPGEWQAVFENPEYGPPPMAMYTGMVRLEGPVYKPQTQEILAIYSYGDRLMTGKARARWQQELGLELPQMAARLFVGPEGNVYVLSFAGVFRAVDAVTEYDPEGPAPPPKETGGPGFVLASPQMRMRARFAAAMQPVTGDIVIYNHSQLQRFNRQEDGNFELHASEAVKAGNGIVACLQDHILIGMEDGTLQVYDATLKMVEEMNPAGNIPFRSIQVRPDGKQAAVLLHNDELWIFDAAGGKFTRAAVSGQGRICAANYAGDALLVADDFTRLSEYDALTLERRQRFRGPMTAVEKVYRFGIRPLYVIFPKPTEMKDLVKYLLTRQETAGHSEDLSRYRNKLNIWQPFWSSLIFMLAVLGLSSCYVARKDF